MKRTNNIAFGLLACIAVGQLLAYKDHHRHTMSDTYAYASGRTAKQKKSTGTVKAKNKQSQPVTVALHKARELQFQKHRLEVKAVKAKNKQRKLRQCAVKALCGTYASTTE